MNLTTTLVGPGGTPARRARARGGEPADRLLLRLSRPSATRTAATPTCSIGLAQILVAQTQAAPFSQVCKVYAPVYRQITDRGLTTPSLHANPYLAYGDVLRAWRDYLAH